ncbi:MAG: ATP-binding cassette domain-containing protein [Geodermatophilaceae bacterium]|nr:ATP-binding cassette domain-containing protein [Geodermatophilaceae bacterium]
MSFALRAHGLWKSYAAGVSGCSARVWVLRGVSLQLEHGECIAVVGRPGAGKSTLLHCLARLRQLDAGDLAGRAELHEVVGAEWLHARTASIVVARDVASVRGIADRVLLLQEGRLHPMPIAAVRRVAEQRVTSS